MIRPQFITRRDAWLPGRVEDDDYIHSIDEIQATDGIDVRELPGGWLVLKRDAKDSPSGGLWLHFAVLEFRRSDDEGEFAPCLFFGEGPGGAKGESLREGRHTYWGEDGYIFYPNGKLITAAFRALAEFYDDLCEEE